VREDSAAARLEKLEASLAHAAPPGDDFAFLADLLSLPASPHHALANLSPQRKKEATLQALVRQLERLARRQPVVMIFEDAHWIDPTSRELLDLIVERVRSLPVLLIVTFRPDFQRPWTLVIGRAEIAQMEMRLGVQVLVQCCGEARLAEARFAGDQHDLADACPGGMPLRVWCSWKRRRSSAVAVSGDRPMKAANARTLRT
jgi:hypothetical protein